MNHKYPIQHPERLRFGTPEQLIRIFEFYPMDEDFLKWVRGQGYIIKLDHDSACGAVYPSLKWIIVGTKDSSIVDLILGHELVHVALSNNCGMRDDCWTPNGKKYMDTIDSIAERHLRIPGWIDLVRRIIPVNEESF